jgi:NitT/TauT family transport system substrate-binding protein
VNTKKLGLRELHHELSRREFLRVAASVGAVGAGAVLLGCGSDDGKGSATSTPGIVADPPPETTTIRLPKGDWPHIRLAPVYLAEQFLPEEGFTNVQYIDLLPGIDRIEQIAAGEIDIGLPFASSVMAAADAGDHVVALAGVHNSSFLMFGNERVQTLRDLKGKRIFVIKRDVTEGAYSLMAALLGYVGVDLEHEVEFVVLADPLSDLLPAIQSGTIDAWILGPPISTAFRNANIGHVILDGAKDPPWSQYFGGMATGNRDFVEKHPAATKRALRAILKATDVCAREPERAARYLVDKGFTPYPYDQALAGISDTSYAAWREFDAEDTMRFYALRLKEAGLVKSRPDELIARATNWRYLEQIKRELAV